MASSRSLGQPGGHHTRETLGILAAEGYTWCGDQCDDDLPLRVSRSTQSAW